MIKFAQPKKEEYAQIADLINRADQIYLNVHHPETYKAHDYGCESEESLIQGSKTRTYLCAYKNDRIIGYASFRLKNPQTVWLSMFYVDTAHQRIGIGSLFLKEIEEISRNLKALTLVLETDKKAIWSSRFYQKNNYKILSDQDLKKFPFNKALEGNQVESRYLFGKELK